MKKEMETLFTRLIKCHLFLYLISVLRTQFTSCLPVIFSYLLLSKGCLREDFYVCVLLMLSSDIVGYCQGLCLNFISKLWIHDEHALGQPRQEQLSCVGVSNWTQLNNDVTVSKRYTGEEANLLRYALGLLLCTFARIEAPTTNKPDTIALQQRHDNSNSWQRNPSFSFEINAKFITK